MKKNLILSILMLLALKLTAQKVPDLDDNIFVNKSELLARFTHYTPGRDSSVKLTRMPVDTFIVRINQFKMAANQMIDQHPDENRRELERGDINYFIYNFQKDYAKLYGYHPITLKADERSRKLIGLTSQEREKLAAQISNPDFKLDNVALYKVSAAYRHWLSDYLAVEGIRKFPADPALGYWSSQIGRLRAAKAMVNDPFIKEDQMYKAILTVFAAIKDSTVIESTYKDFMATATDQVYKDAVKGLYTNYKSMQTRFMAPDFSFKDINGKSVTLVSLRGQYVYIDLWATWCEPCKEQFPFLAPIEKKLEGKMHFVGISIDRPKDEKIWKAYVKSARLGGIQLLADKGLDDDFIKKFNVRAVPRFLIIDPEGRVLSGDAKAPNDPQLVVQLEDLLKK